MVTNYSSPRKFPIWAVAVSPAGDKIAAFERHGAIHFLEGKSLRHLYSINEGGRCKRAKWLDDRVILATFGGRVRMIDTTTGEANEHIRYAGNTVEDFIWDKSRRYLVTISYLNKVDLYHLSSGEKLDEVHDQIDYSKGLSWLLPSESNSGYPLDFLTFGRSGTVHHFRIHNDAVMALGPIAS